MSRRYEVFYTYVVDASMTTEADSEEDAQDKVDELWKSGEVENEKLNDLADFEILYVKKR